MKLNRLFEMLFILIERKTISAQELADHFEVSIRTIYRDIDTLSAANIPVYANRGRNGGIAIMEHYVLNKSLLTKNEQQQIISSLKPLQYIEEDVSHTLAKLSSFFTNVEDHWIDVDLKGWHENENNKSMFATLKNAILNKQVLRFSYYSNKEECTERIVEPHQVMFKGQDWYLYAFCLLRNDFRYFKLNRINDLEIQNNIYQERMKPEIERKVYQEKIFNVLLKVNKTKAHRVLDEMKDFIIEDNENYYLIEIQMDEGWIYSYLLTFADCIEVLEPKQVRDKLVSLLTNTLNIYKT